MNLMATIHNLVPVRHKCPSSVKSIATLLYTIIFWHYCKTTIWHSGFDTRIQCSKLILIRLNWNLWTFCSLKVENGCQKIIQFINLNWAFVVTSTQNHWIIHLSNITAILNKLKIFQDHQIRKFSNTKAR